MNAIENHGLEVIRKWEQESASGEHPMVFISYAYDDDEHRLWVRSLRDKLRVDGINAITDEALPNGYPLNLFMEQIITSPLLKFVVCVCSASYAKKADSGNGGVGYEQAIMTRELTKSVGNNKIIPILRQNPNGYVPTFLGTKKYLDFRYDQKFNDAYSELIGDIFETQRMPQLGRVPDCVVQKRLKATSFSNDTRKNKRSSQKNDERERIIKLVERIPLKIKRKIKIDGLSMTACELIVAILEKNCSALKTSEGICVDTDKSNTPFQSNIPLNERISDVDAIVELCDRGLLRPYNDKIYRATDKAIKNAEKLRRLDETRIFFYAPDLVKSFFPDMANEKASFRVLVSNNDSAKVVIDSETTFQVRLHNRRETEIAIEYLYREKLIENLRFVDKNDANSGSLTITDSLNLRNFSWIIKDDGVVRIAWDVSQKGRHIARIHSKTTENANAKPEFLNTSKEYEG